MTNHPFKDLGDKELLTLCLYGESRGEPPIGKLAVAHVVLNRAARPGWWGQSVKDVILKPRQFSCFNLKDPNLQKLQAMADSGVYEHGCLCVAVIALAGLTTDPTGGATHYCAVGCRPDWAAQLVLTRRINRHLFYREA